MDSHAAVLRVTTREQSVTTQKDSFLGNYSFHPPPPRPLNISLPVCDVFRYSYLRSLINYTSSCTSMKRVCKKGIQSFQLEFERTSFPRHLTILLHNVCVLVFMSLLPYALINRNLM